MKIIYNKNSIINVLLFFIIFTFKVNSQSCPAGYSKLSIDSIPICHKGPTTITSSFCTIVGGTTVKGVFGLCPTDYGTISTSGQISIINNKVQYNKCSTKQDPFVSFGQFGPNCGIYTVLSSSAITFNQTHRYFVFSTCNNIIKNIIGEISTDKTYSQSTVDQCISGGSSPELTDVFDYGEVVCPDGYEGYPNCVDIDECKVNNGGCAQICKNKLSSYDCTCDTGYKINDSDPKKCDNINECTSGTSGCQQNCFDTIGSFFCSCNSNYTLNANGKTCDDIDECSSGTHQCTGVATCSNTIGGYYCQCPIGYRLDSNGLSCVDVNECIEGTSGCNQVCANTDGSYYCTCNDGYMLGADSKTCVDINECTEGTSGCNQVCTKYVGGFTCSCNDGYRLGVDSKTCVDINECTESTSGCGHGCVNTDGSYYCSCNDGYRLGADSKTCVDINECTEDISGCAQICTNTIGSFTCSCNQGYKVNMNDNKKCDDIDECSTTPNICNDNSKQCVNKEGTYSCIQIHSISSVTPSTTKGGEASFKGNFGDYHDNLSISIGVIGRCELINITSTLLHCTAPPGDGIHSINFTQNGLSFIGKNMYNYQVEVKKCLNDCTSPSNGQCNTVTGECKCNIGYTDFDCSIKIENEEEQPPKTNVTVDPNTGGSSLNNQQTNFEIYFKTLTELDFNGNQVKSYSLKNNWSLNKTDSNIFSFSQFLNDNGQDQQHCEIKSIVEEIVQDKEFTFADTTFTIKSGMVKFTIIISNYTYTSYLNTLRLDLISSANEIDGTQKDNCNLKETEIDTSNINDKSTFNYIKISKNNKILSGRFINLLVSDGRPTYYPTTSVINETDSSAIVSLHLPHFTEDLMIDPDFSVLVSPNFKSSCNESNNRKWVIPVAVVVPVVCVAALAIVTIIIVKRKKTAIKVGIAQLKNLNK